MAIKQQSEFLRKFLKRLAGRFWFVSLRNDRLVVGSNFYPDTILKELVVNLKSCFMILNYDVTLT